MTQAATEPLIAPFDSRVHIGRQGVVVSALTVGALVLRLVHISADAYWRNELFSIYWVRHSWLFLVTHGLFIETNPPLHYVMLKAWVCLFGSSEIATRSLSALASVACVPLLWRLGRALGSAQAGLIAAALFTISPVQIYFSDETRAYALLPALVGLLLLGLCRLLAGSALRPDTNTTPALSRSGLLLYVGSATALLYTHAIAGFILAALASTMLLVFIQVRLSRQLIIAFFLANAAAAILGAPAILAMASQAGSSNIAWMPSFSLVQLLGTARFLLIGPMLHLPQHGGLPLALLAELTLAGVAAVTLFLACRITLRSELARSTLLLFPLFFLVLVCSVSLIRPILIPRIMVWTGVPVCLAVGFVLTGAMRPAWKALMMLPLLVCLSIGIWSNLVAPDERKPDWPALLADVGRARAGTHPPDVLVAGPHAGPLGVAFYGRATAAAQLPLRQWLPDPKAPWTVADDLEARDSRAVPITTAALAAMIGAGRHPVLFLDAGDVPLIDSLVTRLPHFNQARRLTYPGLIVFRW